MVNHGHYLKGHFAQLSNMIIIQSGILHNGQPWSLLKGAFCLMVSHGHHSKEHSAQWSILVIIQRDILHDEAHGEKNVGFSLKMGLDCDLQQQSSFLLDQNKVIVKHFNLLVLVEVIKCLISGDNSGRDIELTFKTPSLNVS